MVASILVTSPVIFPSTNPADTTVPVATSLPSLAIHAGQTVQWSWAGGALVNIVSGVPGSPLGGLLFQSGAPTAHGSFAVTFVAPGVYPYYCDSLAANASVVVLDALPPSTTYTTTATTATTTTTTTTATTTITTTTPETTSTLSTTTTLTSTTSTVTPSVTSAPVPGGGGVPGAGAGSATTTTTTTATTTTH